MAFDGPVPLAVAIPFADGVMMAHERVLLSMSDALRVRLNGVVLPSSDIVTLIDGPSVMIGSSLTSLIVTFTVIVSVLVPSETCTMN